MVTLASVEMAVCEAAGFVGPIYAVHPTKAEVGGRRTYATVDDLPEPPDAAFVAVNAVGTGPATTIRVVVPDGPPPATVPLAPAAGKAKAGKPGGQKTLVFVWKPPTSDGGSAVLGYQVRVLRLNRNGGVASRFSSQEFSSGTRKVVISTRAGQYAVQVRARNAVGWSTYSVRSNVVRAQ